MSTVLLRRRDLADELEHLAHRRALADEARSRRALDLAAQHLRLPGELAVLEDALDLGEQVVEEDGLQDVVGGAGAQRLDRGLDAAVRGHDQRRAVCGESSRARRSTARPSAPGMRRSVTTTAKSLLSSAASAARAVGGRRRRRSRRRAGPQRGSRGRPGSSSATRMASAIARNQPARARRGGRRDGRGRPGARPAESSAPGRWHGGRPSRRRCRSAGARGRSARRSPSRSSRPAGGLHRHLVGIAEDGAHVGLGRAPPTKPRSTTATELLLGARRSARPAGSSPPRPGGSAVTVERGDRVHDDQAPAVGARQIRRHAKGGGGMVGEVVGDQDALEERHRPCVQQKPHQRQAGGGWARRSDPREESGVDSSCSEARRCLIGCTAPSCWRRVAGLASAA